MQAENYETDNIRKKNRLIIREKRKTSLRGSRNSRSGHSKSLIRNPMIKNIIKKQVEKKLAAHSTKTLCDGSDMAEMIINDSNQIQTTYNKTYENMQKQKSSFNSSTFRDKLASAKKMKGKKIVLRGT